MLNSGPAGYSSAMSAHRRVCLRHDGQSSDMSARGGVCLTVVMVGRALT